MNDSRRPGSPRRIREPIPDTSIKISRSDTEREQRRAHANELEVSVPQVLTEATLAEPDERSDAVCEQTLGEVSELRYLIASIVNNVNRLAKVADTSRDLPLVRGPQATLAKINATLQQLGEAISTL